MTSAYLDELDVVAEECLVGDEEVVCGGESITIRVQDFLVHAKIKLGHFDQCDQ